VYTLTQFADSHSQHSEVCAERLEEFSDEVYDTVEQACRDALIQLQQQLETLVAKPEGEAGNAAGMSLSGGNGRLGQSTSGARGSIVSMSGGLTSPNGMSTSGSKAGDKRPQQQVSQQVITEQFGTQMWPAASICAPDMSSYLVCWLQ
jgi:hypothetical protein